MCNIHDIGGFSKINSHINDKKNDFLIPIICIMYSSYTIGLSSLLQKHNKTWYGFSPPPPPYNSMITASHVICGQ